MYELLEHIRLMCNSVLVVHQEDLCQLRQVEHVLPSSRTQGSVGGTQEVMSLRHQLGRLTTSERVTLVAPACTSEVAAAPGRLAGSRSQDLLIKYKPGQRVYTRKAQVACTSIWCDINDGRTCRFSV